MSDEQQQLPPAAAMISHRISGWDQWKSAFDDHEGARAEAGAVGHFVNRGEDDPDHVTIYVGLSDVDRAKAFMQSEDLQAAMQDAGVASAPEVTWLVPVREAAVWDRELPAMIVTHRVADFDSWLEGYNAADDLRAENGIVGHAVNRSLDDPSVAVIYHQAETFDALRAFLQLSELQDAMKAAGVTSEPEVSFHTGGWAKLYA